MHHLAVALQPAGAADDQQQRVGPIQLGERPHGDIGALQRLDATDEQQHRRHRWAGRARCVPRRVAGREEGVLDARRDDLDLAGRLAVQPAELALLLGAADADRVGAADDLGLGTFAPLRLESRRPRPSPWRGCGTC